MSLLQKDQIHLVNPRFREMVINAWSNNEYVPFGVIFLSDYIPTETDSCKVRELILKYKWKI